MVAIMSAGATAHPADIRCDRAGRQLACRVSGAPASEAGPDPSIMAQAGSTSMPDPATPGAQGHNHRDGNSGEPASEPRLELPRPPVFPPRVLGDARLVAVSETKRVIVWGMILGRRAEDGPDRFGEAIASRTSLWMATGGRPPSHSPRINRGGEKGWGRETQSTTRDRHGGEDHGESEAEAGERAG